MVYYNYMAFLSGYNAILAFRLMSKNYLLIIKYYETILSEACHATFAVSDNLQ